MRALVSYLVVVALATSAAAQPAAPQPYPPPQPAPAQPYPPQAYPAPGYGYAQPQAQLTLDEQYLLERGYISDGELIGGGALALFFGFGLGQAVQGRWSEKGYIFTLADAVTGGVFMWSTFHLIFCFEGCSERDTDRYATMMLISGLGHLVFRTWETVDAFSAPGEHNRRLRALHMRLGMPVPMYTRLQPYVAPPRDGDGAVAGVSLRF
jgi:hypothetical protein